MDAATLQTAVHHVRSLLVGRRVRGTAIAAATLDLCVFVENALPGAANALRIALGSGTRRRFLLERVRLTRDEHLESENTRALERELDGAEIVDIELPPGERTVTTTFVGEAGRRRVVAELFGARGNWFLLDEKGRVLALAARPGGARSAIGPGTKWTPPAGNAPSTPPPTAEETNASDAEAAAWIVARAAEYEAVDRTLVRDALARELATKLRRESKGLSARRRGLEERQQAEARADEVRREAELLMASSQLAARGRDRVLVQDWYDEGREREIRVDPKLDLRSNAEKRFARAKSLEEGRVHTAREIASLDARIETLGELEARLDALTQADASDETVRDLDALRADVDAHVRPRKAQGGKRRKQKEAPRKPFQEYESQDGTAIWVGRGRTDNDKLTLRHARGNDLWLHIGGGLAGSHVVVRLDRGKTASLETLLDAGTLALWFSKGRGRPHAEVLYTPRKHVRKPKGFPAGRVEVLRSKTLQLHFEEERLARVLATRRDSP